MNRFAIRTLDEIVFSISDIHSPPAQLQARAVNVAALGTVANHHQVKLWLVQRKAEDQKDFMRGLLDLALRSCAPAQNPAIRENLAFDVLSVMGELCRRESTEDAPSKQSAERSKKIQAAFVTVLCSVTLPEIAHNLDIWGLLNLMKAQFKHDEMISDGMCNDLLEALPTKVVAAPVAAATKKDGGDKSSSSSATTTKHDGNDDDDDKNDGDENDEESKKVVVSAATTILSTWTKDRKERSKHLLFIDETRQAELGKLPLVSRALKSVCAQCKAESPEKGKFFSACGFCRACFYCSPACSKAHWAASHKVPCVALKKTLEVIPNNNEANAKQVFNGNFLKQNEVRDAFCSLFYENRAFMFTQRADSMKGTSFEDFFMNYSL